MGILTVTITALVLSSLGVYKTWLDNAWYEDFINKDVQNTKWPVFSEQSRQRIYVFWLYRITSLLGLVIAIVGTFLAVLGLFH